jgi:hypothetical protein
MSSGQASGSATAFRGWPACGRESALRNLDIYTRAFILRNGFHVNGDQLRAGFSNFSYRPFTLEGNFLGMQAVHEMLLQSWSPTPGMRDTEIVRIFPATPWRWRDASFTDLRTEGGHRVSARRCNNATEWFELTAGTTGTVRIADNFEGRQPRWSRRGVKLADGVYSVRLRRGQRISAEFDVPDAAPPPPEDLAEPVTARRSAPYEIPSNNLPIRIGADSEGGSLWIGGIRGAAIMSRALTPSEIAGQLELRSC